MKPGITHKRELLGCGQDPFSKFDFSSVIIIHSVLDLQHLSLLAVLLFISESQFLDIIFCHTKGVVQFSNKCFPFDIITQCYCDQDRFPNRPSLYVLQETMNVASKCYQSLCDHFSEKRKLETLFLFCSLSLAASLSHTEAHRHTQYQVLISLFFGFHIFLQMT